MVEGSRDQDEVIIADLDLDLIQTVRDTWQFYRDRRPESYEGIASW
jgi:N-carbamoylputrescine amidase